MWCGHYYLRWGGHNTPVTQLFHFPDVLGKPASLIGSELPQHPGSGPSLCPTLMLQGLSYVHEGYEPASSYIRNIIPDDMASPFWSASPYRGGAIQTFTPA
jgi:hypothetical protein